MTSHILQCELLRVPCPMGCGLNELRGQIEWHLKERCGKRQVSYSQLLAQLALKISSILSSIFISGKQELLMMNPNCNARD